MSDLINMRKKHNDWHDRFMEEERRVQILQGECDALKAEHDRLRKALEKLARLGNGDQYGNSDGNMIARQALGAQ